MLQHKRYIAKILIFCFIAGMVTSRVNQILNPKWLQKEYYPTTLTYTDFYNIEQNTVDVVFLGSSHAACGFSPMELYQNYGIKSYNLGCEQQNMLTSYYWLKEALRYQTPKVVILDVYMLFTFLDYEPLNTQESTTRKAIDYMKWSPVKIEAVNDICRIDKNQDILSYYFTNIRFHNRWTELKEEDFTFRKSQKGLMGYVYFNWDSGIEFTPILDGDSTEIIEPNEVMLSYLEKIIALCKKEDIELILCKTPHAWANLHKYNYLKDYVKEKELLYLDFNEKELYETLSFSFAEDVADIEHANHRGAGKITNYFGKLLKENYGFGQSTSQQYDEYLCYYQSVVGE